MKNLIKHYLLFSSSKASIIGSRWVILLFAYKTLNIPEFALLALSLSLAETTRAITDFGSDPFTYSRIGAENKTIKISVITAYFIKIYSSLIIAPSIAIIFFSLYGRIDLALIVLIIPITNNILSYSIYVCQKFNIYFFQITQSIVITITAILCVTLILTNSQYSPSTLVILPEIVGSIFGLGIFLFKKINPFRIVRKKNIIQKTLSSLIKLWMVGVLYIFYTRLDLTIVRPLLGEEQQAIYSMAFRFIEPISFVLAMSAAPLLIQMNRDQNFSLKIKIKLAKIQNSKNIFFLLTLSFSSSFFFYLIAKAFGMEHSTIEIITILSFAIPIKFLNIVLTSIISNQKKYSIITKAAFINFFSTYLISIVLYPALGILGVALGALMAEFINAFYQNQKVKYL